MLCSPVGAETRVEEKVLSILTDQVSDEGNMCCPRLDILVIPGNCQFHTLTVRAVAIDPINLRRQGISSKTAAVVSSIAVSFCRRSTGKGA
jgi:hypothetical protein